MIMMMMNRVAPKLHSINNSLNGSSHRLSSPPEVTNKKVKFDLATISYQVSYDDHHSASVSQQQQQRVPLWKRHVRAMYPGGSRSKIMLLLLKQITTVQWIKLVITAICAIQCFWQIISLYRFYQNEYIQTSVSYEIPEVIELPAVTLCIPIIIPYNPRCIHDDNGNGSRSLDVTTGCTHILIGAIFNQSLSEYGHQCRIKSGSKTAAMIHCANISPTIETYYQNKRCYTYLSEITAIRSAIEQISSVPISEYNDVFIQLVIQSSNRQFSPPVAGNANADHPQLYVHQIDQIPVDLIKEPVRLDMGRQYRINYHYRKTVNIDVDFFRCRNYSGMFKPSVKTLTPSSKFDHRSPLDLRQLISRQNCFDKCSTEEWRNQCGHCFPATSFAIRRDLLQPDDRFCQIPDDDDQTDNPERHHQCHHHEEEEISEQILLDCNRQCPNDCTEMEVDVQMGVTANDDYAETEVIIKRNIIADQIIRRLPLMDGIRWISYAGGLIMFWAAIVWIAHRLIDLLDLAAEVIQLNCLE